MYHRQNYRLPHSISEVDEAELSSSRTASFRTSHPESSIIGEYEDRERRYTYSNSDPRTPGQYRRRSNTLPEPTSTSPYVMNEALISDLSELQPLTRRSMVEMLDARFQTDKVYVSNNYIIIIII